IVRNEPVDRAPGAFEPATQVNGEGSRSRGRRRGSSGGAPAAIARPAADPTDAAMTDEQRIAALSAMAAVHRAAHPEDEPEDRISGTGERDTPAELYAEVAELAEAV